MLPLNKKKQNDDIDLVDDILDEDNPFKNIGTEDIWIGDDLFDDDDNQTVKGISKDIIDTSNDVINDTIQTDFSTVTTEEPTFPTITTLEADFPTIIDDCDNSIQTIIIDDGIQIPNEDGVATDTRVPKKVKIISGNTNRIKSGADKILTKYKKQKPIGTFKVKNKKATNWLKQAGQLNIDDQEIIDYNNNTNITDLDDLETIDYSKYTSVGDLTDLKRTSGTQLAAKNILKNYRNSA